MNPNDWHDVATLALLLGLLLVLLLALGGIAD